MSKNEVVFIERFKYKLSTSWCILEHFYMEMKWQTMDVLDLKFSDNEFDAIIDKSTLDAILCTNQSFSNVLVMLKEI